MRMVAPIQGQTQTMMTCFVALSSDCQAGSLSKPDDQSDVYVSAVYDILSTPGVQGGGHNIMHTCAM